MKLGAVRISNMMSTLSQNIVNYVDIMREYIDNDMVTLNELFLKSRKINNVIFVGDCVPYYARMKVFSMAVSTPRAINSRISLTKSIIRALSRLRNL